MHYARFLTLVAAFALVAGDETTADDSPAKFLETWAATWQTSDVDKMLAFYDTADQTLAIESLGHVRKGPAEIRKMYQGAFDELIFDRVTLKPISQGEQASVAWATCTYRAEIRLKEDGSKYILEARGSFVVRRDRNSWKITLEHFSTIPDVPRVRPADK